MLDEAQVEAVTAGISWVSAIERLGGWAVVVWVVYWFMKEIRSDRRTHEAEIEKLLNGQKVLVDTWKDAVASFRRFEEEEERIHSGITERLDEILEHTRS